MSRALDDQFKKELRLNVELKDSAGDLTVVSLQPTSVEFDCLADEVSIIGRGSGHRGSFYPLKNKRGHSHFRNVPEIYLNLDNYFDCSAKVIF